MLTLAADPRHLGARIGITAVLHTWGSALTHHPHVHMIVPGGGIAARRNALDLVRAPAFLLPVRVLGKLFRRCSSPGLIELHDAAGCGSTARRPDCRIGSAFLRHLAPRPQETLACLCQSTIRRAGGGARLSVALHPPGGDLEPGG